MDWIEKDTPKWILVLCRIFEILNRKQVIQVLSQGWVSEDLFVK